MCALIALLNACAWSIITPPFQGRDEVDHFAYVAQLAESATLPKNGHGEGRYSPEERGVLEGLHYYQVRFSPGTPAIASIAEQRRLTEALDAHASLKGSGEAGVATSEPPLYYALQTIPYFIGQGHMLLQLQLMRLFGALLGALTTLLIFLFLRESLPGAPSAATIGALCVALAPLFAFMSGSLNPETLMLTICAAIFLCLARAFRRGLTRSLAVKLGVLVAIGFVTKLNFIGFALGMFAGLTTLALREVRRRGREPLLSIALTAGIGVVPVALYAIVNVLSQRPTFGFASGVIGTTTSASRLDELSYIWEMYLPRLPGMAHYFVGMAPYKDVWFDRSVGLYGWMDTMFPSWVDSIALVLALAVALLCGRELIVRRAALRARLPELGCYAAIALGLLAMLGASSYQSDALVHKDALGEPRYLLPLLALLGAALALAVRGAGRRFAPIAGAALVMLFLGHDVFSQLQVIARYYG
ncbi:MAG TPA: DUF2142 domain-containing protein [Solirubrobacteraceae bacterium]|jgi:hypothetical protein